MKDKRVFALYKGDTWLMDETIEEIAAARGCKPWSIYFLTTPVNIRAEDYRMKGAC